MNDFLIVDDDDVFRGRVERGLVKRGHKVCAAASGEQALKCAARYKPNRILLDLRMPGESGLELVPQLLEIVPEARIVILTGYGSIATTQAAIKQGVFAYITKPCDIERILLAYEEDGIEEADIRSPTLAQVEWDHIHRVIADCQGNITHAAKKLGLDRRSLQRKMAKSPSLR